VVDKTGSSLLSNQQQELIASPVRSLVFLQGAAGCGKTTAAVQRLLHLLQAGVPARNILVLAPQRTLASPYTDALRRPTVRPGGQVTVSTVGGLAQRMVELFWPLVAAQAGFSLPEKPPTFLTLETAQYYMARLVRPLLDEGAFEGVVIDRNRLYSQILDNLNKAAVVGFPHGEIGARLSVAWAGQQSQKRIFEDAQACASLFRQHCLTNNLLDFSLQIEVFVRHLWTLSLCRDYLMETYSHLLVDNVEEDTPVAHDLLRAWLTHCQSALLVYDDDGGYRRFLGADPQSGLALRDLCHEHVVFSTSFVASPGVQGLAEQLGRSLRGKKPAPDASTREVLVYQHKDNRYYPQMLDWVADRVADLVRVHSVSPGEIVVLSPFMPDGLRFSLVHRLEQRGIPTRSHRPSRALREETATRCLLTLTNLAHPHWNVCPTRYDVAYALRQAIEGMDPVRAQLLADIIYRVVDGLPRLSSFDRIAADMQSRITYVLGERYERLRLWIERYANGQPAELDHFLSRLFGDLLSQAGYGFHHDYDAATVTANLIESVKKFRWVTEGHPWEVDRPLGQEYVEMVREGVVAAQYVRSWLLQPEDAVLLAPAYTFLMSNRPVDVQFWLDVGGSGWWERLYQPLTHPYVLSRHWPPEAIWTDVNEADARRDALFRLTQGLLRRCRRQVYLGLCELGEDGSEQRGELLRAIHRVLRGLPPAPQESDGV
jgi:hypothetical protein